MKTSITRIPVISVAALSLMLGTALAQRTDQSNQQNLRQQQGQQFQQRQQKQVSGQVLRTKSVQVRKQGQNMGKNMVVLLETQDGQRMIVDLGPTKNLQDVNIQEGDRISVRGQTMRVGDRPVLMAQQVRAQGQQMQVQRQQQGAMQQSKQVKGQIQRMKEVSFRGTQQTNQVVLLETQQGQQLIADLGSTQNLQDLNLQQGMQIQVSGEPVRIGDRIVLLANRLKADGQSVRISQQQRQPSQQQMSQRQNRSAGETRAATEAIPDRLADFEMFNTFARAIFTADVADQLQQPGPYTVFAPTDEAFEKLPAALRARLRQDPQALAMLVLHHVIPGASYPADSIPERIEPIAGDTINVGIADSGVVLQPVGLEEVEVTRGNIRADNGIIHAINEVLIPRALALALE